MIWLLLPSEIERKQCHLLYQINRAGQTHEQSRRALRRNGAGEANRTLVYSLGGQVLAKHFEMLAKTPDNRAQDNQRVTGEKQNPSPSTRPAKPKARGVFKITTPGQPAAPQAAKPQMRGLGL